MLILMIDFLRLDKVPHPPNPVTSQYYERGTFRHLRGNNGDKYIFMFRVQSGGKSHMRSAPCAPLMYLRMMMRRGRMPLWAGREVVPALLKRVLMSSSLL